MLFYCVHSKYQVNVVGGKKMRKKYLRELKKNLKESNLFWEDDIRDIIHITNILFKKCTKQIKEFRRKINEKI